MKTRSDSMDINLKPCPRCGGEAEIRYTCEAIVGVSETGGYQPYCTDCLIAPPYAFFTKQDAADWWNDRKEQVLDEVAEQNEMNELKQMIQSLLTIIDDEEENNND